MIGCAYLLQLLMSMSIQRRIVVTGTPIQNNLSEFFSLADFCNPGILGQIYGSQAASQSPVCVLVINQSAIVAQDP